MTENNYTVFLEQSLEPVRELYSSTDSVTKARILTVRVEEGFYSLLEALAEQWKVGSVSRVVRTILSYYFLPMVYEFEWSNLAPEKLAELKQKEQEQGFSLNLARFQKFLNELAEYSSFLAEAEQKSSASLEFIQQNRKLVETIAEELAGMELKLHEGLKEKGENVK